MENKYYTPDLEEFCSGFEYEEWVESYPEGFWTSTYVYGEASHSTPSLQSLRNLIKTENIRTKFLDQSDIESFGFKCTGVHVDELEFELDEESFLTLDVDGYMRIADYGEGDVTRFSGVIKNKTEFRKLLKQLNIIE